MSDNQEALGMILAQISQRLNAHEGGIDGLLVAALVPLTLMLDKGIVTKAEIAERILQLRESLGADPAQLTTAPLDALLGRFSGEDDPNNPSPPGQKLHGFRVFDGGKV